MVSHSRYKSPPLGLRQRLRGFDGQSRRTAVPAAPGPSIARERPLPNRRRCLARTRARLL